MVTGVPVPSPYLSPWPPEVMAVSAPCRMMLRNARSRTRSAVELTAALNSDDFRSDVLSDVMAYPRHVGPKAGRMGLRSAWRRAGRDPAIPPARNPGAGSLFHKIDQNSCRPPIRRRMYG